MRTTTSQYNRLIHCIFLILFFFFLTPYANAARIITSATLDSNSSVTVTPSASITARVYVTTDGTGLNNDWQCTTWSIGGSTPIKINHTNYSSAGNYNETFAITSPAIDGTYNASFIAYRDNACTLGASATYTLTNGVTVVNTAPTITAPNSGNTYSASVSENTTAVTDVNATDTDTGQTLTYSLSGADAAKFTINASTGLVSFFSAPDFEVPTDNGANNVYDVNVTVTDSGSPAKTDTQTFQITVTDVNEPPTITAPNSGNTYSASVPENTTAVTDVDTTDPDTGQTLTYSLSGTDAAKFTINASTGLVSFTTTPDFEVPTDSGANNVYDFTVTVTDNGSPIMTDTQDFHITVTNISEGEHCDAWDTFRSLNDRNISTKIVGKPFDVTIASLNVSRSSLEDFNGTVCVQIVNLSDQNLTGWNKLFFNNVTSISTSFTLNRAIGGNDSAGVDIHWKNNVDTTCPLTLETNSTHASDRFAIRPSSFSLNAPNAIAGTDFNITYAAPNFSSTASTDYNETVGNSFDVTYAEHNASCQLGSFSSPLNNGWSFTNGSQTVTTHYSEAGVVDINISDIAKACASRYTNVDCDDANVSDGLNFTADLLPIGTTQTQISIKPHHFDLNATLANFNGGAFTYLSTDLNMSSKLDLNVSAKNEQNNITLNYDKGCYAQTTTLDLNVSVINNSLTKILYHENLSNIDGNVSKSGPLSIPFAKTIFTQGSAPLSLLINFDRSRSVPITPFDFNLTSAALTDSNATTGTTTPQGNAKYVYGRARAYDIKTDQSPTINPVELEVYSSTSTGYVNGMPQNILRWYRNLNHSSAADGNVSRGGFSAGATDGAINVSAAPLNGLQSIGITLTTHQTVHLDISPWLWYSPNTNYDYTGDCTKHPCFDYQFVGTPANNIMGISSGTFQGSDFTLTPAKTIIKKGIKVFR